MSVADSMKSKLETAFDPVELEIVDESHLHAGHSGWKPEGETHFRVTIVSPAFEGLSRVERHREVHAVLADELASRVHALALTLETPKAG